MNKFNRFYSGSIDSTSEDINTSFSVEPKGVFKIEPKRELCVEKRKTSSVDDASVFSVFSEGVMPEKSAILQETELYSEKWKGKVAVIEEDSLVLDVYSVKTPQNKAKLRIKKQIIEGDKSRITIHTGVYVSYQKVRNYQGLIEKRLSVRLREPAELPIDIKEKEFEEKMKQFSYMLANKE